MKWKLDKPYALPLNRTLGNPDGEYSCADWRRDMKTTHPIRYFLQETLPSKLRYWKRLLIEEPLYWLTSHTTRRYHKLDLRYGTYRYGYIDANTKVMHALFKIVRDFVEVEQAFNSYVNWDTNDEWRLAKREIMKVYTWVTKERTELDAKILALFAHIDLNDWVDNGSDKAVMKQYRELEDQLDRTDDEMLQRVIQFRRYMWT